MADAYNNWSNIANVLIPACEQAVDSVAKAGAKHVQDQITANNQIRTGFMLSSVYASTPLGSDYSGGVKALPEEKPSSNTEAVIGVAASYAQFPNYGTVFQAPKPFFEPGIDQTASDFDTALEQVKLLIEDAGK